MTIMPFGPFAPDRVHTADFVVGGKNVYPRSDKTYGPVRGFMAAYNAIAQRVQGAFYSIDDAGNTALWAGTAAALYNLVSGVAFNDASKVGGYTCAADETWEFEQVGQRVMAWNIADPIQSFVVGSSTDFANLAAAAPKARHGGMVKNFLLLGNTSDGVFGLQPDGLWWSAIGDVTNWPTVGTSAAAAVQSGRINISGQGGWIQKIVPKVGTLDAIILQERQVTRCVYVGSPEVFSFQPMEGARGTPAPNSVAVFGGVMFYLGEDGFYACDGTQSMPIGQGLVDQFFLDDVNASQLHRICAVIDPVNRLYIIGYPSLASSGNIDKLLFYNIGAKMWAPPQEVAIEWLTRLGSVGYTLEDLDAFGTLETLPASLDSSLWIGDGIPVLAGFSTSHAAGSFSGSNEEAIIETGDIDVNSSRVMSSSFRPLVQGTDATLTGSYAYRQTRNTAPTYAAAYATLNRELQIPFRINARHIRLLLKIAAAGNWEHAYGVDLEISGLTSKLP